MVHHFSSKKCNYWVPVLSSVYCSLAPMKCQRMSCSLSCRQMIWLCSSKDFCLQNKFCDSLTSRKLHSSCPCESQGVIFQVPTLGVTLPLGVMGSVSIPAVLSPAQKCLLKTWWKVSCLFSAGAQLPKPIYLASKAWKELVIKLQKTLPSLMHHVQRY